MADGDLRLMLEGGPGRSVEVPADATRLQRVYVIAPPQDPAAIGQRSDLRFWVEDTVSGERAYGDTIFNGKDSADARHANAG